MAAYTVKRMNCLSLKPNPFRTEYKNKIPLFDVGAGSAVKNQYKSL